ncbi:MBL fold metallo-hydrolase [Arthrobacter sp. zg-Y820]|uniref:MBL fold metallo-hydrolase n=1 Tax=unclassified Arthrobacter TaxID=235627 RepID=UPI001E45B960|nr:MULTISPECIES: MBL fold metallo-hydrolase [unclassified Arthrobacter]MCC9196121.1 MBL fold metallo-hydrolase [Arthrobacter sp. zg-Y820]MDK1278980.1 MBL fold metallo-hydrolase [Arthrobacter sp. zg.Y820]MDK1359404.1 MBL fold metallo-hydrolase [Arthrobacter sp. zg-Y1219]WIB08607.1 MBL fold metallo-hydrolase [Arthrobacter sp. zg-Y820]
MKLTIVGCSGSFPGPASPASCYLVTANDGVRDWRILLDLGNGSMGALQRYMDLRDIDAVLLTHLHPDHCMDLCGLHVAVHWDPAGWNRDRIKVWGPQDTADRMATAYGLPTDPGMHEDFEFLHWTGGETVTIGPFTVTPYPVRHPADEAYALRIEATGIGADGKPVLHTLAYSGDTDSCDGLEEAARDSDVFLCEAAFHEGRDDAIEGVHLTGKRAGAAASAAHARRLLLTHLPVWNDANTSVAEARETYAGDLAVAVAGVSYDVGSPFAAPLAVNPGVQPAG